MLRGLERLAGGAHLMKRRRSPEWVQAARHELKKKFIFSLVGTGKDKHNLHAGGPCTAQAVAYFEGVKSRMGYLELANRLAAVPYKYLSARTLREHIKLGYLPIDFQVVGCSPHYESLIAKEFGYQLKCPTDGLTLAELAEQEPDCIANLTGHALPLWRGKQVIFDTIDGYMWSCIKGKHDDFANYKVLSYFIR